MTRLTFTLSVNGRPVSVEAPAPPRRARLDQILPALRCLDDAVVEAAIRAEQARGRSISCRKGCSACCEAQPVPVTPPEAFRLARLVEGLPRAARTKVRAAFAAALARLREAGLADIFLERRTPPTREEARAVAARYMALRIPCPFLTERACGIYEERPFVCRQYVVTSPPESCDDPLNNPVAPVPVPARFASSLLAAAETALGRPQHTVPLVLTLAYAERHAQELAVRFEAEALLSDVVGRLGAP